MLTLYLLSSARTKIKWYSTHVYVNKFTPSCINISKLWVQLQKYSFKRLSKVEQLSETFANNLLASFCFGTHIFFKWINLWSELVSKWLKTMTVLIYYNSIWKILIARVSSNMEGNAFIACQTWAYDAETHRLVLAMCRIIMKIDMD